MTPIVFEDTSDALVLDFEVTRDEEVTKETLTDLRDVTLNYRDSATPVKPIISHKSKISKLILAIIITSSLVGAILLGLTIYYIVKITRK